MKIESKPKVETEEIVHLRTTVTHGIFKVIIEPEFVSFWPRGWGCDDEVDLTHKEFLDFVKTIEAAGRELS